MKWSLKFKNAKRISFGKISETSQFGL